MTVFVAGDSTVQTYVNSSIHQGGWGQFFDGYFVTQVTVDNRAIGGRTSRRFIEEGRLTTILSAARAGDWLFVQFGTNDSNQTATYDDGEPYYLAPATDFKTYMQMYIDGARARRQPGAGHAAAAQLLPQRRRIVQLLVHQLRERDEGARAVERTRSSISAPAPSPI